MNDLRNGDPIAMDARLRVRCREHGTQMPLLSTPVNEPGHIVERYECVPAEGDRHREDVARVLVDQSSTSVAWGSDPPDTIAGERRVGALRFDDAVLLIAEDLVAQG